MKEKKEFLKEKFIDFQLRIAQLNLDLHKQEDAFAARQKELYLNLFEILDAFEAIEETIQAKEETMDKTARLLSRNIRAIHRKILRMLQANHVSRIEFPDRMARMDYCKVLETREIPDLKNETIITIVKNGYIHEGTGAVLRKAEVITVMNAREGSEG